MDKLTVPELKEELRKRGKDHTGTKPVLFERLQQALQEVQESRKPLVQQEEHDCGDEHDQEDGEKQQEKELLPLGASASSMKRDSKNNASETGSHKSGKSVASAMALEAARRAGLEAKLKIMRQKHDLEEKEREIRRKKEEMELQMEIAEARATEEALATSMNEAKSTSSRASLKSRPVAQDDVVRPERDRRVASDIKLMKRMHLPSLNLTCFTGDTASYKPFLHAFEANIANNLDCEAEKLLYLLRFTEGKPHDIVQTCVHLPEELGYTQAVELLNRRYDSQVQTVTSLVDKMLSLPVLRPDDGDGLDDYGIFLRGCLNALESLPHGLGYVDARVMCRLLEKMPYYMVERWRRVADGIEQDEKRLPDFRDLVTYVEREARITRNPCYGRQVLGTSHMKRPRDDVKKPQAPPARTRALAGGVRSVEPKCLFCDDKHPTEACGKLQHKTAEEKTNFVREKGLCFGCLQHGHRSRHCRERRTCGKCSGRHPTVLHEERTQIPTVTTGHLAPSKVGGAKLQVLRVRVGVSGVMMTTNAFLDSGSTHSFITGHLLDKMKMTPRKKTLLKVSTIRGEEAMDSCLVPGLLIGDLDGGNVMELPPLYVLNHIPVMSEDIPSQEDMERYAYLEEAGVSVSTVKNRDEIGLLIGGDAASVMEPLEVCPSRDGGPYAVRTRLGWVLGGAKKQDRSARVHRIKIMDDLGLSEQFEDRADTRRGLSVEDARWCAQMETGCKMKDGKYEISLPFREQAPPLGNNREVAEKRLDLLKRTFARDPSYACQYKAVMAELLEKGYAEEAPEDSETTGRWYLPHFGVKNPQKEKVRVVFDCASKFRGTSLNDTLLQGPDLANPLLDVLIRFREQPIAFTGDLEAMFLQVLVPEAQRDFLRFLWWPAGDVSRAPREYRNTRHLFGATSSPSCANLALHRTAEDFSQGATEARDTVRRNFYVDDLLKSTPSEEDAIKLLYDVKELCSKGGFNLTKISSNSTKVLRSVPNEARAKKVKTLELGSDVLPVERALGVTWDTHADTFKFQVDIERLRSKPMTKRGMLSATASCYDPLGLVTPSVVRARILIQDLFRLKVGWDDRVPESIERAWVSWLQELPLLSDCTFPRCLTTGEQQDAVAELHHFSDASQRAYGTASYLRTVTPQGDVHCALVMSKARLAPVKPLTIPRLELAAAKLAVDVGQELARAMDMKVNQVFWTDSTTVLKYIRNETTRFHVFVANRLAAIHEGTEPHQWRHVPTSLNPADLVSRGADARALLNSELWHSGPQFLRESVDDWPKCPEMTKLDKTDPELKTRATVAFSTATTATTGTRREATASSAASAECSTEASERSPVEKLLHHYGSWKRLVRAVALLRRVLTILKEKSQEQTAGNDVKRHSSTSRTVLIPSDLHEAELCIVRDAQRRHFGRELGELRAGKEVRPSSRLTRLTPFFEDGVVRVGGRLGNSHLSWATKHPPILPNEDRVVELLIQDVHQRVGHEGRQHVLAELGQEYWVLGANSAVRRTLSRCVSCRRRQRPPESQRMADLPEDRVREGEKPFSSTGVDYFGPFFVKRGRGQIKKYGVIFTCLVVRAVHIEVADSLTTDSFLCALRRFVARRGTVSLLRSDQGTNFTGAERELRDEVRQLLLKGEDIRKRALEMGIEWQFNPPHASHFGGAWERQIRTIRKILGALLTQQSFTEETLHTLLCEAECIMNNRPLTPVSADPRDELPLTPNHLLHTRCVTLPPSDSPAECDLVGRKQWKQAAYMADMFWRRWRREYLPFLQQRHGPHTRSKANVKRGDVVLMVDDSVPRGVWPMGRVQEAIRSNDGRVRSVRVLSRGTAYYRPVSKIVKIAEVEE